jgi:hypothetical protein
MTLFWISCSIYVSIYFVCTSFFVDQYLCEIVYLKTYTHERCYFSIFYIFFISYVLYGHTKQYHSLKTMLILNDHFCTSLIICFVLLLSHILVVESAIMLSLTCRSTICFSFAHSCVISKIEKMRIPCCAHCIHIQKPNLCMYLRDLPNFIYSITLCLSYLFSHALYCSMNLNEWGFLNYALCSQMQLS